MVGPLEPKSWPSGSPLAGPTRRDGGRPDSGRAPARGLRRHAAEPRFRIRSVRDAGPAGPPQQPQAVGTGQVKVGLVLPLSAGGNAGVAAQSMKNAAEMALAEFQNPNIQLLIKDDAGSPQGAQPGNAAGARRRRGDHSGSAVRGVGAADGAADAHPRRLGDRVLDRFERGRPRRLSARASCPNPTSTASSNTPPAPASDPSPRCCPTMPMAMWWRPRSSRRSAAGTDASSRSKNTAPTAPRRRAPWRRRCGAADALFIADDGDSVRAGGRCADRGRRPI